MSLVERILRQAARTPEGVALTAGDGTQLTYGSLRRKVLAVRHGLIEAGLRKGDGVLFSVRPSPDSLVLALGVVAAQGTVIFADPGAGPEMFSARMRLARPRWSAAESLLYMASRLAPARAYARRRGLLLPDLSHLDVNGHVYAGGWLPGVPRGALSLNGLMRGPAPQAQGADPQAPAAVIFTSGTTAQPRAVVHTGASLAAALELLQSRVPLGRGDVVHTDQLMLGLPSLIAGAHWSMPPLSASPHTFLRLLSQRKATHTYAVPVQLARMLDTLDGGRLPESLRFVLLGSAPATAGVLRRAVRSAPQAQVLSVYAMTEILPVSIATAQEKLAHAAPGDLVGRPMPGITARIAGDGELMLAGPNLCLGYLGDPPLGELATGDLARLDGMGRIVLAGRKKDMLIRGSFNLYPGLYEPTITALDGVDDAAYVGIADPEHGDEEVVLAIVATRPGVAERLRQQLPNLIDHAAVPDRIVVVKELPRSGRASKVDRSRLREWVR